MEVGYKNSPWGTRRQSVLCWLWACKHELLCVVFPKEIARMIAMHVYFTWRVKEEHLHGFMRPFSWTDTLYEWIPNMKLWKAQFSDVTRGPCPECMRPLKHFGYCNLCGQVNA